MVQFAFAIPGSSTEVERLFSIIGNVWPPNKGKMKLATLEAELNVRFNSKMGCSEYFALIKNNKALLAQVQSGTKYKLDTPSTSTSAVSVSSDEDSEDENEVYVVEN